MAHIDEIQIGDVLPWSCVAGVHKIRNGIYQRNGRLISLLTDFGRINPCYPDFHGETSDIIHYTGSGRRGDQKLDAANQALMNAIKTGHSVPLFNKLAVNQWQYLGLFTVIDAQYIHDGTHERMIWKFTLRLCQNRPR
jgi:hypothetical protein